MQKLRPMLQLSHSCAVCRGVATMPNGLPIPGDTVRQTWGKGVRSGMYPISDTELYWFTVFNAPEVCASCLGPPACIQL